jgi:integrase
MQSGGRHKTGGERRFLPPIIRHFGTTSLAKIDLDAIERGAAKLFPAAAHSTRNRQFITPAVAVIRHAAERKWCDSLIVRRPSPPPGMIRWLTLVEADALIAASATHLSPLLVSLLYTGARVGELLWLDWKYVDLNRGHLTIPRSKNGQARGIPLHPRVIAALANLPHRDGEVFRTNAGKPYSRPASAADSSAGSRISTGFQSACRRVGIKNFRVHDCRHTFATWHYIANRDLGALMKIGGWKTEKMVLRYAHVNVGELAHTINALPGGNLGQPETKEEKAW